MKDASLSFILDVLQSYSWRMGVYGQFPQLTVLRLESLTSFLPYRADLGKKWGRWSKTFSSTILDRSSRKGKGRFSIILESKDPKTGRPPLEPELWAEGSVIMLAGAHCINLSCNYNTLLTHNTGSDTSAISMCATFFYLTCNPEAYTKTVTEIRDTFSCVDDIRSGSSLESCLYLSACIEESMRLSPPTPGTLWREVERGGAEVDGRYIPEGYDVGT